MFGNDQQARNPQAPAKGGMAGKEKLYNKKTISSISATTDPNYQTLAGLNQNVFGNDQQARTQGGKAPMAPAKGGMAGRKRTSDNHQNFSL